jgi:membrane protein DedA with SNARE-associated domain
MSAIGTWAQDVIDRLGYVGVAVLIALESLFPPIPSELILPLTGFLAGQGRMWLPAAVLAATIGSVTGALALYGLGAWWGEERLRQIVDRYGRYLLLSEKDLDRAIRWFNDHGGRAVLIGRLAPVVRSLVSIPAGIERMNLGMFVLYTAIGSAIWNSVLIGLGWWLGDRWEEVENYANYLQYVVIAAIVAVIARFVWKRKKLREST